MFWVGELGFKECAVSLNVTLCDDQQIQQYNSEYRGKDKATDVLSFPVHDSLREDFPPFPEIELGDLFICDSFVSRQADEFNLSYVEEFYHLFIHSRILYHALTSSYRPWVEQQLSLRRASCPWLAFSVWRLPHESYGCAFVWPSLA